MNPLPPPPQPSGYSQPNPPFMMPPFAPWGPPPPPQRGWFRTVFTVVLVLALLFSIFMNFALLVGSMGGHSTVHTTVQDGDPRQVIAVVPLTGFIGAESSAQFSKFFDQIDKDSNVKAVVLHVETPGGSVASSDEMWHRLDRFKSDHSQIPVIVSMGGMATSGGYYISARADYIFAEPTTWTGNIGVIAPLYNVSDLASKWGVKETTITAPTNGYKNAASPFSPVTEADKAYLQGLVDNAYKRFTSVVKTGRGAALKKPIEELADGRVFSADDAKANGLVDRIGYADDAYVYAAGAAGLKNAMIVRYHEPPSLLDAFGVGRGSSSTTPAQGSQQAPGVTVNGFNVNVDVNGALREMATPRVMYLWRGQ